MRAAGRSRKRLDVFLLRTAGVAEVIPLNGEVLRHARDLRSEHDLRHADAVVLASVLVHLTGESGAEPHREKGGATMMDEDEDFPRTETFTDCCGNDRTFSVELRSVEGGSFLRARETGVEAGGYEFAAYSAGSPSLAWSRLRQRIREGLAIRYLEIENGRRQLGHDVAAGTIGYGSLVIDGQEVPFEEFLEMMQVYEGFRFSLRISDAYEPL